MIWSIIIAILRGSENKKSYSNVQYWRSTVLVGYGNAGGSWGADLVPFWENSNSSRRLGAFQDRVRPAGVANDIWASTGTAHVEFFCASSVAHSLTRLM